MKKVLRPLCQGLLAISLGVVATSCNSSQEKSLPLKTDEDKAFYSIGVMFGSKLKDFQLTDQETDYLVMGLRESIKGKKSEVDVMEYQMKVRDIFNARMKKVSEENSKKGKEYLEKFVKDEGAQKTASGLAYKITQEGTGAQPKAEDMVEVHYHGTLIDGTVFDSSKERGQTAKFPLNRVIKGWTEGLQLVKEGGKVKLVIPPELAYGDQGAPPKIPGGATLTFDVELVKILPPEKEEKGVPAPEEAAPKAKTKGKK